MATGTVSPSFCPCCFKPSIGLQIKPTQSFVCVSSLFYASFDVVIPVCVQSQLSLLYYCIHVPVLYIKEAVAASLFLFNMVMVKLDPCFSVSFPMT